VSATDAKTDVDTSSVDTSRGLCLDGVQQSSSGHPARPTGWPGWRANNRRPRPGG